MAAPSSAYRVQTLNTFNNGVTTVNSIAIPNDTIAILKARFFLDQLFQVQTAAGSGFIGGCIVGSFNYNHHNTNRIGSLRSYNGGVVAYYNDAGLNTLSDLRSLSAVSTAVDGFKISGIFKTGYYDSGQYSYFSLTKEFDATVVNVGDVTTPAGGADFNWSARKKYFANIGETVYLSGRITSSTDGNYTAANVSYVMPRTDCFKIEGSLTVAGGATIQAGRILFDVTAGRFDPDYHPEGNFLVFNSGGTSQPFTLYIDNFFSGATNGAVTIAATAAFKEAVWFSSTSVNLGASVTLDRAYNGAYNLQLKFA